jgi:hypothetical protein
MPTPNERPGGFAPEDLQVGARPGGPEVGPQIGGSASPPPASPPPAKLTPADVAAAIAATPTPGAVPTVGATPASAADVDLIEPEWVDKAEEVVRAHSGDPYGEEEAIEELQEDYLNKRYGITVTDPNASDTKPKGA